MAYFAVPQELGWKNVIGGPVTQREVDRAIGKNACHARNESKSRTLSRDTMVAAFTSMSPSQQFVALFLFLVTFIACRNVPKEEISKVLARCQQDRMLPLITGVLGAGIVHCVYTTQIARSLSGLSGDCITLENAFGGKRLVSMAICEHLDILKAYLKVDYQQTAGKPFVVIAHFNLLMGSRKGVAIGSHEWASKGRIKPRSRLVTAVFILTEEPRCLKCRSPLSALMTGDFLWYSPQDMRLRAPSTDLLTA